MDSYPAIERPQVGVRVSEREPGHSHAAPADPKSERSWLDRFGFGVSFLCALHCAAMPLLMGAFPAIGTTLFGDERMEWFLFGAVVAIGAASLVPSYVRRHRDARPLVLFALGVSALLASRVLAVEGSWVEGIGASVAALMVATAHLWNLRLTRECTVVCHERHDHVH